MKNELNDLLDQPKELETLYRNNKVQFKQAFLDLYPLIKDKPQAEFWLHENHWLHLNNPFASRPEYEFH